MVVALFTLPGQAKEAFEHIVYLKRDVPPLRDSSVSVRSWCTVSPAIPTKLGTSSFGCTLTMGIGLDGVDTSPHSTLFVTKLRNARAVKSTHQIKSRTRSVQARIICVGEKLVVETFMDTSPFIIIFQEEKSIVCHYYTKTKR
jgi:hypothetical protein